MRRLKPILIAAALMCIGAVVAFGQQSNTGEIRGFVTDEQGAAVVNAKIIVRNTETGLERSLTSDTSGRYRALLLPVGMYDVAVEDERYKKWKQSGIRVQVGDVRSLNVTLEVGDFTSVVTITGDAPVIETSVSQVSSVVSEELINNLPVNGRDYRDFVLITPTAGVSDRNGVTLGGSRGIYTNLVIDGADSNSPFFAEQNGGEIDPSFTVSQESVKEFRVLNSGFSAEFGRSLGGLINVVTKSGTNDYRGSGFFFFQNEALVADQQVAIDRGDDIDFEEQTDFERAQFGGSLGGPIIRDKAFFFISGDIQTFSEPNEVRFDWTDAERATYGDMAVPIDGISNLNSLDGELYDSTNDNQVFFAKVDAALSETNSLSVRFNYSNADQENGLGAFADNAAGMQAKEEESTTSTVGSLTTFLSDSMINEVRVQYATNTISRVNNGQGPETRIDNFGRIGSTWFLPIEIDIWRFQVSDNFNWLLGEHDLKFGFDWNRTNTKENFIGFSRGRWDFDGIEEFFAGDVDFALQKVPLSGLSMEESGDFEVEVDEIAFYVQDKWQPTERLTIDLGLRWEGTYNPDPPSTNPLYPNTGQLFDDTNNFQPRAGIAYDVFGDGSTVVRAAGGLFYGRTPSILYFNTFINNGVTSVVQFIPGFAVPYPYDPQAVIDSVTSVGRLDIDTIDPDYEEAEVWRFNAGIEREVFENTSVSVDFMYADGDKLMSRWDVNMQPPTPGAATNGRALYSRSNRPVAGVGEINQVTAAGTMEYLALTISAKTRAWNNVDLYASYTASRDKDSDSNERSSGGITVSEPGNPEADFGLSDRDRTHRFVVSAVWNAPFDINVSGILTYQSGNPYSALWGRDLNGDGEDDGDRAASGSGGTVWVERNTFREDEFALLDARVSKVFRFGDRYEIEGIFEAFNLFDWASITDVNDTSRFDSFGKPDDFQTSRRLQLGARFRF